MKNNIGTNNDDAKKDSADPTVMWVFLVVFAVQLVLSSYLSFRGLYKNKEMRNIFNYIMIFGLNMFMIDRMLGIVYDLYYSQQDHYFELIYAFFQLPQDLLMLVIMAQFLSWVEVYLTFENILFIQKHLNSHGVTSV